jgi:hypothetical protein
MDRRRRRRRRRHHRRTQLTPVTPEASKVCCCVCTKKTGVNPNFDITVEWSSVLQQMPQSHRPSPTLSQPDSRLIHQQIKQPIECIHE